MATGGRRPPRMDVQTMYPNFYAEQHKHHVQENNTMSVTRKRREGSGGTTRRDGYGNLPRPTSRNGLLQLQPRLESDASSTELPRGSKRAIPPISATRSSNQQEGAPLLNNDEDLAGPGTTLRPPSRQVALRGELCTSSPAWDDGTSTDNTGVSPRLRPLPFPTALTGSARSLLEATTARLTKSDDGQSLEDLVMNAPPRTRYARRELHRQGSARPLARISTAPTTLRGQQALDGTSVTARAAASLGGSRSAGALHSHSTSAGLTRRPPSRQAGVVDVIEAVLPGVDLDDGPDDEDDDTNFFLTELEAAARAAKALQIALKEKDRELEARVYANLGNLALAQENFGHALSCHHRDLHLCSSKVLDCRLGRARAHRNLSIAYAKLHRRDLQLKHEKEARDAEQNAYLNDIAAHQDTSVGNICFQASSDIDPALVDLVSQNLAEIVRGLSTQTAPGSAEENNEDDSITSALEEEWRTAEVDLEAALAALSTESQAKTATNVRKPHFTPPPKSPIALSRHVSARINNYSSPASLTQPEE
ncbi:hypothetical protein PHYSODRAFT_535938 [Phytophthora sojae]|uniref:Uncharacterized protein n=1 Tax=Phytophthora sojae (strain P6497) TaxID=1094619 RepID=G5AIL8_PHYSP|nr:hypothetical protein PHYSODRAFT_535938 [Phytophthora sojae]EGZ04628.1 hypothetical protein PHYSODRAFT_535938 [Phytophthora sojae]|eukprot:XP_009539919.1 hypothetical protein PHYSODRAFT_535938 [Phytophthora sojae]